MIKFYECNICGNIIEMIEDSGVVPSCCGEEMEELIPGTTDTIKEKHIPVLNETHSNPSEEQANCIKSILVKVGEIPHPMIESHYISWIAVKTDQGFYRKDISKCKEAQASFCFTWDEQILAIYSYCNLHGLWINKIHE